MNFKYLIMNKDSGKCTVQFNNPKSLNALNKEMLNEISLLFDELENDTEIKIVVLTGNSKAFIAGADIAAMYPLSPEEGRKWGIEGSKLFRKIETSSKIVIAAIEGYTLGGGCELAMACDLRIATENAKFGQPEVSLGIIPGFSGTQRLVRLVGLGKAKELIYTGRIIDANEAFTIGLINKVVSSEELDKEIDKLSNNILKNSFSAVKYSKLAINKAFDVDFETGMDLESNLFGLCFANKDQKIMMKNFLDKTNKK